MSHGFDVKHTLWDYMWLVPENYKDQAKSRALADIALERLKTLPGAESVAIARVRNFASASGCDRPLRRAALHGRAS